MKLQNLAKLHSEEACNVLIEQVINFISIKAQEGKFFEVVGATKGDGFFEYDIELKK